MIIRYDKAFVNVPKDTAFCFRIAKDEDSTKLVLEEASEEYTLLSLRFNSNNLDEILEMLLDRIIDEISEDKGLVDINTICLSVIGELEKIVDEKKEKG